MADREDRAAALLERTLAARAGEAPSVPGLAERVRGRARRRRATGVVTACAVAVVLAAGVPIAVGWTARHVVDAPIAADPSRDDTPRDDTVEPAPEGWRWESYGGIQLQVPDGWGWGTTGAPPCLQGRDAEPYVGRPGGVRDILCPEPVPALNLRVPYLWFDDQADVGTRTFDGGWSERTDSVGGVVVTVLSDDPDLTDRILGSAREVTGTDANGCSTERAVDPYNRPAADPGFGRVGVVQSVSICRYTRADVPTPLRWSGLLVGKEAADLVGELATAPRTNPALFDCSVRSTQGSTIVLHVRGSAGAQDAFVFSGGCADTYVDDGSTYRELTERVANAIFTGTYFELVQNDGGKP